MTHDQGATCACTTDHRPRPMEFHNHHIWPEYLGGPNIAGNLIWLCPTSHVNVHEILRDLLRDGYRSYYEYNLSTERTVNHYAYTVAVDGLNRYLRR